MTLACISCDLKFPLLPQEWEEKAKKARKKYDQVMVEYKATGKVQAAAPAK